MFYAQSTITVTSGWKLNPITNCARFGSKINEGLKFEICDLVCLNEKESKQLLNLRLTLQWAKRKQFLPHLCLVPEQHTHFQTAKLLKKKSLLPILHYRFVWEESWWLFWKAGMTLTCYYSSNHMYMRRVFTMLKLGTIRKKKMKNYIIITLFSSSSIYDHQIDWSKSQTCAFKSKTTIKSM